MNSTRFCDQQINKDNLIRRYSYWVIRRFGNKKHAFVLAFLLADMHPADCMNNVSDAGPMLMVSTLATSAGFGIGFYQFDDTADMRDRRPFS